MSNWMPKAKNMTISERIRKLREVFSEIKVEKDDESVVCYGTVENDSQIEKIYFKEQTNEKIEKQQKCKKISKVFGDENEKAANIELNLDGIEINKAEVRECRVILKDVNKEIKNGKFRNVKIIKSETPFLKQHLETISNPETQKITSKKVDCEFCGLKMHKSGFSRHMRRVHPQILKKSPFCCQNCNRNFPSSKSLKYHMISIHSKDLFVPEPGKFECDFDGKLFKARANLLSHMSKHKMRVKCDICNAEINPKNLNQHIRDVHAKDRRFQCYICQKSLKSDQGLKIHIQTHKKALRCSICLKMFSAQMVLNNHIKTIHKNPGKFECEMCDKKFNQKINLKAHQKYHDKNRQKPFKCQRCDFATDNTLSYKSHQNVHERQDKKFAAMKNPIKCEKCPTFCRDKNALRNHMFMVHPKVLYQCDLCGMYIKTKDHLSKHIFAHLKKQNSKN